MRVDRVSQDEDTNTLLVHGDGFFSGGPCTAKLRGTLFRAGTRAVTTRTWSCRARSEELIAIPLAVSRDQPGGLLEGPIEVTFEAKASERSFLARSEQAVRVRLPEASLADVLAQSRTARAFAEELGLTLEPHARGLSIAQLTDDGLAARAGLQPHDVIVRLDGAPVERATDLVPAPRSAAPSFEVLRAQNALVVSVPWQGQAARTQPGTLHWLTFAVALLSVLLLPIATLRWRSHLQRRLTLARATLHALAVGMALTLANALVFAWGAVDPRWAFLAPWLTFLGRELVRDRSSWRARAAALSPVVLVGIGMACLSLLGEAAIVTSTVASATWVLLCSPPAWLAVLSLRGGLPRLDAHRSLSSQISVVWLIGTSAWLMASFAGDPAPWQDTMAPSWHVARLVLETALFGAWLLLGPNAQRPRTAWLCAALAVPSSVAWVFIAPGALAGLIGYAGLGAFVALALKQVHAERHDDRSIDPLLEPFR